MSVVFGGLRGVGKWSVPLPRTPELPSQLQALEFFLSQYQGLVRRRGNNNSSGNTMSGHYFGK